MPYVLYNCETNSEMVRSCIFVTLSESVCIRVKDFLNGLTGGSTLGITIHEYGVDIYMEYTDDLEEKALLDVLYPEGAINGLETKQEQLNYNATYFSRRIMRELENIIQEPAE